MHVCRKLTVWQLVRTCIVLGACNGLAGMAFAGSVSEQPEDADTTQAQVLLVQKGAKPKKPIGKGSGTRLSTSSLSGKSALSGNGLGGKTVLPSNEKVERALRKKALSGGGSSGGGAVLVPSACVVESMGNTRPNCSKRYITHHDLRNAFISCDSGPCYANKFLQLEKQPTVVMYPKALAPRLEAQQLLRTEMVHGVKTMARYLRARVSSESSVAEINDLMESAISEIDQIVQPIDESDAERRERLGLLPALSKLARDVKNS